MDLEGPAPTPREPKHLLPASRIERIAATEKDGDPDRMHAQGQGNGVRTHVIMFTVVSLIALVGLLIVIGLIGTRMR